MADRDPATGRFLRREAVAPPAGPGDTDPPGAEAPGSAPGARPVLFVLEDVQPGPTPPAGPELPEAEPPPPAMSDVRLVTIVARGLNAAIRAGLGPRYEAPEPAVEEVGSKAAPVVRRVAARFGGSGLVERTAPVWVVELAELAGAVAGAWGDAIVEGFRRGVARRRPAEERTDASTPGPGDDPGRVVRGADRGDGPERPRSPGADVAPPTAGGSGRELREAYARGFGRR